MDDKLNLILIPSKGRPRCRTAEWLTKIDYPGEWLIVLGNDDDTHDEYVKRWGADRVVVFDKAHESLSYDPMDAFGPDGIGVGVARNWCRGFAESLGYRRFWEFDDDITGILAYSSEIGRMRRLKTGDRIFWALNLMSSYADSCGCSAISPTIALGRFPKDFSSVIMQSYCVMNFPVDERLFPTFKGRVSEDMISVMDAARRGMFEFQLMAFSFMAVPTTKESGGYTEMYLSDMGNDVRRLAYHVMAAPCAARLIANKDGELSWATAWKKIIPKIVSDRYAKV